MIAPVMADAIRVEGMRCRGESAITGCHLSCTGSSVWGVTQSAHRARITKATHYTRTNTHTHNTPLTEVRTCGRNLVSMQALRRARGAGGEELSEDQFEKRAKIPTNFHATTLQMKLVNTVVPLARLEHETLRWSPPLPPFPQLPKCPLPHG